MPNPVVERLWFGKRLLSALKEIYGVIYSKEPPDVPQLPVSCSDGQLHVDVGKELMRSCRALSSEPARSMGFRLRGLRLTVLGLRPFGLRKAIISASGKSVDSASGAAWQGLSFLKLCLEGKRCKGHQGPMHRLRCGQRPSINHGFSKPTPLCYPSCGLLDSP